MKRLLLFLVVLFSFFTLARPVIAQSEVAMCPVPAGDLNFESLCNISLANAFPTVLSFVLIVAIVISLFYLIWGGIKWITSGGDKANVETARNHIIAAIIGLILVFSAWFILNFILQTFFGGSLSTGIMLPGIFSSTPTPTPSATPSATLTPTSSLPPCPTAYPPNFECQLQPEGE